MPRIVVEGYQPAGHGSNKEAHETTNQNQEKLQNWFNAPANWEKLAEQLTKKLGADKFKNVTLTNPIVTYEEITVDKYTWKNPKVTFAVEAKPGYQLASGAGTSTTLELKIRVLYTSESSTQNLLTIQEASSSAAPSGANTADHAKTIKDVNVYLNYTGPAIVLDTTLPEVGNANNTIINGTSPITDETLAAKVKTLFNKTTNTNDPTELMLAITKYVQTFDPKYLSTRTDNGYRAWVSWMWTNRSALSQRELKQPADIFLQQMKDDTEAVYLPIGGTTDDKWLNTFLIRIPLNKFVKAIL
ncbi:hemagglutinin [Mycoplasmopsis synoviae]|nr:hemagglutinin [Mycoplasmopsis synoviae]